MVPGTPDISDPAGRIGRRILPCKRNDGSTLLYAESLYDGMQATLLKERVFTSTKRFAFLLNNFLHLRANDEVLAVDKLLKHIVIC
jgi:hypothetical protein